MTYNWKKNLDQNVNASLFVFYGDVNFIFNSPILQLLGMPLWIGCDNDKEKLFKHSACRCCCALAGHI